MLRDRSARNKSGQWDELNGIVVGTALTTADASSMRASDWPPTARYLKRLRLVTIGLSALTVVMLAVAGFTVTTGQNEEDHLAATGLHTSGVITQLQLARLSHLDVKYEVGGHSYITSVRLPDNTFSGYQKGEVVDVIYQSGHPKHMTIAGVENDPSYISFVFVPAIVLGFVGLIATPGIGIPLRRLSRVLKNSTWSEKRVESNPLQIGQTIDGARYGIRSTRLSSSSMLWVAGEPPGRVVVSRAGGAGPTPTRRLKARHEGTPPTI